MPTSRNSGVCACVNLRRASRAITDLYDRHLAPSGLKVTQFSLLRTIGRADGARISELAGQLALDRTTLTRNVGVLARRRWVDIEFAEDRRARRVRLTAEGRRAVEKALPHWEAAQRQVEAALGGSGLKMLYEELLAIESLAEA